jgi:hypothetical protein
MCGFAGKTWKARAGVGRTTESMCGNRAATRVNILNNLEKHHKGNTLICSNFAHT